MKSTNIYQATLAIALASSLCLASCDDDKLVPVINDSDISVPSKVQSDQNEIVITGNLADEVLNLTFDSDGPFFADGMQTNQGAYIIQACLNENFEDGVVSRTIADQKGSNTVTYTGEQLNALTIALGMEGGTSATIYFRLVHAYSESNLQNAKYSEITAINVTSFRVPLYLVITKADETVENAVDSLLSPEENGIFFGFVGCTAWFNWAAWDIFGNRYATDANDPFGSWPFAHLYQTTEDGSNMWFPGNDGCYYVTVNTNNGNVTYTFVKNMKVSGDVTADLSFDQKKCQFIGLVETTADGQKIKFSGDTYSWDQSTGQDDAGKFTKGSEGTIAFTGSNGVATVSETAGEFVIDKAGSYMVTLDLNNSSKLTYKIADLSDTKLFPSKLELKIGDQTVEMETQMNGQLASGVYTVLTEISTPDDINFVSGDNNVETTTSIDQVGLYEIIVDLSGDQPIVTKNLFGKTLAASGAWEGVLALKDGKYSGLLTNTTGDNFKLTDENGQSYGTYKGWDQYTFGVSEDVYDHFWLDPVSKEAFVEIDVVSHSWTFAYVDALLLVKKGLTTVDGLIGVITGSDNVYQGVYDRSDDWNYYIQTVNANKDGFLYYGCDDDCTKPSEEENYACIPTERTMEELNGNKSLWVSPGKYNITVDLNNNLITLQALKTPTSLKVVAKDLETVIATLTAVDGKEGEFEGQISLTEWNFYLLGSFDDGSASVTYGHDGSSKNEELNVPTGLSIGGGNLWANPEYTWNIYVNLNDNSITLTAVE